MPRIDRVALCCVTAMLSSLTSGAAAQTPTTGQAVLLAVPVLAGSAAYAVAESFEWRSGLDMRVREAIEFYAIIAIATIGGVALNFTRLDPMRALIWTAEIDGVIAVPIMAVLMLLASREDIMGRFVIRPKLRLLGWTATLIMAVTVLAMFAST